jgi:hypothetical protein
MQTSALRMPFTVIQITDLLVNGNLNFFFKLEEEKSRHGHSILNQFVPVSLLIQHQDRLQ